MSRGSKWIFRALVPALCISVAAAGQVVRTQDGRALDASPRIGSAGYNPPVSSGALNSQLYVTGQVTGLRWFRRPVGYFAEDQLHLRLPSAALGGFRRQSVGLDDVLSGTPYSPEAYYERTATALKLEGILAGRVRPGTSVPTRGAAAMTPLGQKLYVDALAEYAPVAPLVSGRTHAPGRVLDAATAGTTVAVPAAAAPAVEGVWTPAAQDATSLFGVARRQDRMDLARELYVNRLRDERIDQGVGREAAPRGTTPPDTEPRGTSPTPGVAEPAKSPPAGERPTEAGTRPPGEPREGQDVFLDLLVRFRQRRLGQAGKGGADRTPPRPRWVGPPAKHTPLKAPDREGIVEFSDDQQIILHGLAGRSKDLFNIHMTRAQRELRTKDYYGAADLYETASLVSRRNPLPRVGMGLALLGAGEPLSAAYQIRRALKLFPPIMETRIDMAAMMDTAVVRTRLRALQGRLDKGSESDRALLHFLATFLHHNYGQGDEAKTHAEKLQSLAGDDELLKAYAKFVLTGERPGAAEAPKP